MRACVARGDDEGAMHLLLQVWAQEHSQVLAEAIEALSPRFLHRLPPLLDLQDWLHAASSRDPLLVTALLASFHGGNPQKKLLALCDFPPDPRLGALAWTISRHKELTGPLLERHGHPECWPPSAPAHPQLAALARMMPPSLEQQLLDAVYASPAEDEPRLVYADYLLSLEHPLGPYFAQPSREIPPRLAHWWTWWLFGRDFSGAARFRHGFPRVLEVFRGDPFRPVPAWSTVEELVLIDPDESQLEFLRGMPSLHTLSVHLPDPAWLPGTLPSLTGLRLRSLAVPWEGWRPSSLGEERHWPALECLELYVGDQGARLDEVGLGTVARRLREVVLRCRFPLEDPVEFAWRATREVAPSIQRVRIELESGVTLPFERQGADLHLPEVVLPEELLSDLRERFGQPRE